MELDSDFARYARSLFRFGNGLRDMTCSDSENEGASSTKRENNGQSAAMKAELREMISQPLVARCVSTKYITSGSRPIIDDLLAGESKLFERLNLCR